MADKLFDTIEVDVKSTFGQTAQPNEHPTQRSEIMAFRMNGVSVNFNLNAYWDEVTGTYKQTVPRFPSDATRSTATSPPKLTC